MPKHYAQNFSALLRHCILKAALLDKTLAAVTFPERGPVEIEYVGEEPDAAQFNITRDVSATEANPQQTEEDDDPLG